jgi:HD-GYP domain-containing protein (c-di-GMP phosphodiesterase class II)
MADDGAQDWINMPRDAGPGGERVRAAELIAALSLATDLGIGVPLEHGLDSTVVAMRLCERLGVDQATASQTYYACLLFYVGCIATAEVATDLFGDETALTRYATPARFGSRPQMVAGMLRAVAPPGGTPLVRAVQLARGLPRLARELEGAAIDRALAAMGDFADLASPYLVGHSGGIAELAAAAAQRCGFAPADVARLRRGALVHDLGRVAVPVRIWPKAAPLTRDEWERVRLHAYHSERVLARAGFLATLVPVAGFHHERLDGSGYHRGAAAATLTRPARLLAAADAYHAMTEPRPHRRPLPPDQAGEALGREAGAGRLDADAVTAVLEAAGQRVPRIQRPAGLSEREAEVVGLLARGLQTKQIARALGISIKTADRHIQNAYGKLGVSTRAAATLFAMEHGLPAWGELPVPRTARRS